MTTSPLLRWPPRVFLAQLVVRSDRGVVNAASSITVAQRRDQHVQRKALLGVTFMTVFNMISKAGMRGRRFSPGHCA
ncbi:hypothetical protein [Deinococcus yavapaiensis]|nr:hypothetical protein [Deinococcus yavapaiensis]